MQNSPNNSVPGCWVSFKKKRKLCKLRKYAVAVLHVVRLMKSIRRLCLDPVATGVEPESEEISIDSRKEQQNVHPSTPYESRLLKLKFSNNITGPIFTGLPLGGDQGSTLTLDLVDPHTQSIVKSGPEASAVVEILVLEKYFRSYIQGYWTPEEFKNVIVRDNKRLIRDPHVTLKDGRVSVSDISFKHTKVHFRKCEIRLGARAVYPYDGTRILEAVTEPFFVKDRRIMGKSHKPLSLDDEVCKMQAIGKGGHFLDNLMKENIKTVRDFLVQYFLNSEKLVSACARNLVETAFANWENVMKFNSEISIMDQLSSLSKFPPLSCPIVGSEHECHSGNLPMVDEFQHSELQNTSESHLIQKTAESNQLVVSASTASYATIEQHEESDQMTFEKFMQLVNSNGILLQGSSVCKGKSKKSWAKISSVLRYLFSLKRLVKLRRVHITKKRKLS